MEFGRRPEKGMGGRGAASFESQFSAENHNPGVRFCVRSRWAQVFASPFARDRRVVPPRPPSAPDWYFSARTTAPTYFSHPHGSGHVLYSTSRLPPPPTHSLEYLGSPFSFHINLSTSSLVPRSTFALFSHFTVPRPPCPRSLRLASFSLGSPRWISPSLDPLPLDIYTRTQPRLSSNAMALTVIRVGRRQASWATDSPPTASTSTSTSAGASGIARAGSHSAERAK